ncbi:MAG: hypothetical protein HQL31_05380 [Planctomycetes bacterium]|nr:hypothetical protein [Planctomycetota bacterium]
MHQEHKHHILVVDDQPDNVFLLELLLGERGNLEIHSVNSGSSAIAFLH